MELSIHAHLLAETASANATSNLAAVEDLLLRGANPNVYNTRNLRTPLYYALNGQRHWDVVELLFLYGATPLPEEREEDLFLTQEDIERYLQLHMEGVSIKGC